MRYVLMLVLLLGLGTVDSSAQTRMRLSKPASVYASGDLDLIANAGTYAVSRDTVTNQILWSTVPGNVGTSFRWTSTALRGDTMEWQLIDSAGTVVQRGRSVKVK